MKLTGIPSNRVFNSSSGVNLSSWLEQENGIYWIEGKPGSGKSTLMKFLLSDNRTTKMLRRWSGPSELIVASHFFWSAGTVLQKSQEGLFRALLYQIFTQCPEIIRKVCPRRFSDENELDCNVLSFLGSDTWYRHELFQTFECIASLTNFPRKVCLFIDGLDEYGGDHPDLVRFLINLAKSPHIKICAASRPWYDFIDAFGKQKWRLSVQDLTNNDILLYINDNLEQNSQFQALKHRDTESATALVQEIRDKAQGVFLWIYLIIRSLLRGLRNVDGISDLRGRLNELPGELEM